MPKNILHSPDAPDPAGFYSQGTQAGGFLFLSGQIPIDPKSGQLIAGNIEEQTRRVLDNLVAVLGAGGASLADVVKITVYLTDMADFADFNTTYSRYFPTAPPARATIAVAALPRNARIEIDAIAHVP
jgi:2-iminobutanoate/2-iminopropanoate deaminase